MLGEILVTLPMGLGRRYQLCSAFFSRFLQAGLYDLVTKLRKELLDQTTRMCNNKQGTRTRPKDPIQKYQREQAGAQLTFLQGPLGQRLDFESGFRLPLPDLPQQLPAQRSILAVIPQALAYRIIQHFRVLVARVDIPHAFPRARRSDPLLLIDPRVLRHLDGRPVFEQPAEGEHHRGDGPDFAARRHVRELGRHPVRSAVEGLFVIPVRFVGLGTDALLVIAD